MGIVKSECMHAQTYVTREEEALELFEYIEVAYNRARIHSALGHLSPAPSSKGPIGPRKKAAPRRRKGCQRKRGRFRFRFRFNPDGPAYLDSLMPWSESVPAEIRLRPKAAEEAAKMADDPIIGIDPSAFSDDEK